MDLQFVAPEPLAAAYSLPLVEGVGVIISCITATPPSQPSHATGRERALPWASA